MKSLLKYTFFLFAFWQALFLFHRLFFILYQQPIGHKIKIKSDVLKAFFKGYPLDFSVGAMLVLLPMTCAICFYILEKKLFKKIAYGLVVFFLVLYCMVGIGDAGLYKEWNAKINMQALNHFQNPSEVLNTLSPGLIFLYFLFVTLLAVPFYFLYKLKIHPVLTVSKTSLLKNRIALGLTLFLMGTALGVITIRGGITNIPINQSIAYFSNDVLANDIAVNPLYSILEDATIKTNIPDSSLYKFRSNQEAQGMIAEDFFVPKDTTISILENIRPNLVYILLESWSADNIGVLGGIENCTPRFDELSKEGLLFPNAYSTAYVSDQGIPAILSAYPSASRLAIINQASKVPHLPCISEELLQYDYSSSFLFGGELVYGNLRGYLLEKKFSALREVYQLNQYPRGRLGVHDEYTFKELLQILPTRKPPFLQCLFTTSSHMPYDYKVADTWESRSDDPEKKYTESVHYADIHLGKFFDEAKKQSWYKNTLFIIVADHSHNSIRQWDPSFSMRHRIPLLFTGGALKPEWKGKTIDKIVSQLDITSTILHQMKISAKRYPWSRDMLNPYTPSGSYYVFFGGMGYVGEQGFTSSYLGNTSNIIQQLKDTTQATHYHQKALSFQQLVYEDVRTRK